MTQSLAPDQSQQGPTLGDLALNDLAAQCGRLARELAVLRAQYQQLAEFVDSKAEVLGLTKVDGDQPEARRSGAVVDSRVEDKAPESNNKE